MRILEITLIVSLAIYFIGSFLKKRKRPFWLASIPYAALIISLLHVFIEGSRWQMYIAYALTVLFFVLSILRKIRYNRIDQKELALSKLKLFGVKIALVFGMLFLAISAFLAHIFPVPTLPAPTGPHKVGTTFFHFIDYNREEKISPDTNDVRSLWVQAWYPAEHIESLERVPMMSESDRFMGDYAVLVGLPRFAVDHVKLIKSHSYLNAPIKSGEETFPIIIYSHGYTSNLSDNTQKMEALASNGYVVFSITHSYESQLSLSDEGRWLTITNTNSIGILKSRKNEDTIAFNKADHAIKAIKAKANSLETELRAPLTLLKKDKLVLDSLYQIAYPKRRNRVRVWTADFSFALNEIERMQSGERESIFKGKLDINRVGAFGASFGGLSAAYFSSTDPRCIVSVNLDCGQYGLMYSDTLFKPYMIINGQDGWDNEIIDADWENIGRAKPYYRVSIQGAKHINIADQVWNSYLGRKIGISGSGSINTNRSYEIYNSYLLAFFNQYLKGEKQELLEGEDQFKEVKFRKY
ncbi:MAG: hypothetical protein KAI17_02655 [Thiotrichaceae bacterium]|nr:hypothetical protein [Thiotrichaceae bacterium]